MNPELADLRSRITAAKVADEDTALRALMESHEIPKSLRNETRRRAMELVNDIRKSSRPNILDGLLAEYGLSSPAGTALLRLAEALMRVPDTRTMDHLIADKLVNVDWREHRGRSDSPFVNLATLCLDLASRCQEGSTKAGVGGGTRRALKRLSTPIVRIAVRRATELLAGRFVHGATIEGSIKRSARPERRGFTHSYDMLGEAALTQEDADRFFEDYRNAIRALTPRCRSPDFRENPGISIKLSALHPRYELTQRDRVMTELSERTLILARMAKDARMGLNIDAEEADRLELSLDVIEQVLSDPGLAGWDGFGIVVQAYGKAAPHVIDFLHRLASSLDRRIMIRLVKGAYWDTEIKRAQVEGLPDFPVYTRKPATDVSYLCCVRKLLGMMDRIYPQFAGHNAHTVSAVLELAGEERDFEFQRIHGMGEPLHDKVIERLGTRCRIYAPVGEHRELLPYLARRMLENGANTSFVSQIASRDWTASEIAEDPFDALDRARESNLRPIRDPKYLFGTDRLNSRGWDLHNPETLENLNRLREPHRTGSWHRGPVLAADHVPESKVELRNPAFPASAVGTVSRATTAEVSAAIGAASAWEGTPADERGRILSRASDLYEERTGEFFALLCREAGKSLADAVAELREAVDFLRYYASEAARQDDRRPLGLVACISPWNFPLAIFTGQVAGALAAGNGVLAKPATQTPLVAGLAVELLHEAGVPPNVLQFVPGSGQSVGGALVSDSRISGVAFTGSTETAHRINQAMANSLHPSSRLVAETGGLNAMIIDSTALPEQAIKDIISSSFQSAGQRCSALRMLYVQDAIYDRFTEMLFGAMDQLKIGDPWDVSTDVGPLIDEAARNEVAAHVEGARAEGRLLKQCEVPDEGHFVGPAVIRVDGINHLKEEVFGPVVHLASFDIRNLDLVVDSINACGYGLTFGLHSRIDARVNAVSERLKVGNIYVNRNQIGAVVGSQPFGGEGLSGTGPKAGGPDYVDAFRFEEPVQHGIPEGPVADPEAVQALLYRAVQPNSRHLSERSLPGPTGEENRHSHWPRGTVLCLGPTAADAAEQAAFANAAGCPAVRVADGATGDLSVPGFLPRHELTKLSGFDVVVLWGPPEDIKAARQALAARTGPLIPLVAARNVTERCLLERHVCIDTTAAGGNATLYAEVAAATHGQR